MCRFKSGIILKNKVVLTPEGNESHSDLLDKLGIEDTTMNAMKVFVRAELIPKDENKATDIAEWKYIVDQDIVPDWYEQDAKRYEDEFRIAVKDEVQKNMEVIAGRAWTKIKSDGSRTVYILDGILKRSEFGETNNYTNSIIRSELAASELLQELKAEFGDGLIPVSTDLTSLDGLKDYGTVEGDLLAIPTLDLYRECRENIPKVESTYWLATPDSTPSGVSAGYVQFVYSDGGVDYGHYGWNGGVRPVFILES